LVLVSAVLILLLLVDVPASNALERTSDTVHVGVLASGHRRRVRAAGECLYSELGAGVLLVRLGDLGDHGRARVLLTQPSSAALSETQGDLVIQ
jgi:hypothetical protein